MLERGATIIKKITPAVYLFEERTSLTAVAKTLRPGWVTRSTWVVRLRSAFNDEQTTCNNDGHRKDDTFCFAHVVGCFKVVGFIGLDGFKGLSMFQGYDQAASFSSCCNPRAIALR